MKKLALIASVVAALTISPAAGASNIAPNPTFDMCTGTVPTSWVASSFATVSCATIAGHTALQAVVQGFNDGGRSACRNGALPAGNTPTSYSYYTTDPTVTAALFGGLFWTGSNCTGGSTGIPLSPATLATGAWTAVSGTINVPANTLSVSFFLNIQCTVSMGAACSTSNVTAYFDDLVFDAPVLAVTVTSLSAGPQAGGIAVRWRSPPAADKLGFNVYREVSGRRVRANRTLIAADGRIAYSFHDRGAPRGKRVRYWIQVVALDGSRSWYGPTRAVRNT